MTGVADTRLLLTLEFPPSRDVKLKVERLFRRELARRLLIPSIVVTEFLKVAGFRIGFQAALTRIRLLKSMGAKVLSMDERLATTAGRLLLDNPNIPIADALIASPVIVGKADYVLSDDEHFRVMNVKTRWI